MAQACVVPELEDILDVTGENDDDERWEECADEDMTSECQCLFCEEIHKTPESVFSHCSVKHGMDMALIQHKLHMDFFSYIKFINYIRVEHPDPQDLSNAESTIVWDHDQYMKPVIVDDGLLQFDIESWAPEVNPGADADAGMNVEDATMAIPVSEYNALVRRVATAEEQVESMQTDLVQFREDFAKMRTFTNDLVSSQPVVPPSDQAIQHLKDEDHAYFDSYGHYGIHQQMLQDKVRTESYRDAILNNRTEFEGKVVLDVGCGTGILSMFAAEAGAKLVIGVDLSDVIHQAMDIVRENGLEDKIKLIKGRMEDVDLPVEKVDIIISEWMGYFLLFESMLDSVVWARDHYLAPGGAMLPSATQVHLVGVADHSLWQTNLSYWDNVYGFKMSCMKTLVLKEGSVYVISGEKVITNPCMVKEIDTGSCTTKDLEFSSDFALEATATESITAIVGYFDVIFSAFTQQISFTTGPHKTPTHWKQTILLLEKCIAVEKGDVIKGHLVCTKHNKDPRALRLSLQIDGTTMHYSL